MQETLLQECFRPKEGIMKLTKIIAGVAGLTALACSTSALAQEGPWQVRLRATVVAPDESADIEAIGGDVEISDAYIPELDITYFFNDNISAELILGTSYHKVTARNTAVGDLFLGKTWVLPPTLTLQYHFAPDTAFNPYLGAGLNYTIFYSQNLDNSVVDDMDYDDSFGFALQAGADFKMDPDADWFLNIDAKKIWMNSDVTVNATTALGATVGADVDINPWVLSVGVGRRF